MNGAFFIFYVADQSAAAAFYRAVFGEEPVLDVPGMTEFKLCGGGEEGGAGGANAGGGGASLGLMPESGIKRLLGDPLPDPAAAAGVPRAELYIHVNDPAAYQARAIAAGARELSPIEPRGWGDEAGYVLDLDGHVVAFARRLAT